MLKKNKKLLILTSVLILLPMLAGQILWNRLPDQIATHFNAQGMPDDYSSKAFAVIGLPAILLGLHWLCLGMTAVDPKHKNIGGKPLALVLWICPLISVLCCTLVLLHAMNVEINIGLVMMLVFGALFIVIGNYLPKCRQNYTVGVKTPWALNDEENWNRTHRFAGRLWTIGGALIMLCCFTASIWIFLAATLSMAFAPVAYSYMYYRKHSAK